MKKIILTLITFSFGFAFTACNNDSEKDAVRMTMSEEAVRYAEHEKKTGVAYFSQENFAGVKESFFNRTSEQNLPEVKHENTLALETYNGEKVYSLSHDGYKNIVYYIHGGAFVFGISSVHVEFCDMLSTSLNAKVYMPLYPLAPQVQYDKAYSFLKEVYSQILKENKKVYIMGDSAGGSLALSLCQQLRDEGLVLPEKMVLIGPFVDCSMENPEIKQIEERDFTLQTYGLRECGKMFGKGSFDDALLCPLKGKMEGLPETLLINATDEILYPDGKALYEKMKKAGCKIQWIIGDGYWHVFPVYPIPERKQSVDMITSFINGKEIVECKKVEVQSKTGILRGYLKGPAKVLSGKKKAPLVVIMHGLDDWCEFDLIKKQADGYAQEGYAVLTVDFDGHGYSDGKFFDMTLSKEFEDGEAIMNYAKSLKFASEINLIGHSQGGVVASVTAAKFSKDIKKLVLLAPGGMIADNLRAGRCFGTNFDPANPPEKFIVFGDEIGKEYVLDAMKMDLYKMAEGFSGHNILLVSGGADPLVKEEIVRNYEKLYSKPEYKNQVTFEQIPDAPHDFYDFEPVVIEKVLNFLK